MASLDDVVSTLKNLTQSVSAIYTQLLKSFPQATGTATTATGGAATLPANPVGFITIQLPGGAAAKVPYYNT
jgi:hypothetical protein